MEHSLLLILSCVAVSSYAWSVPFYPVHAAAQRMPYRYIRHVRHVHPPHPPHPQPYRTSLPINVREPSDEQQRQRPKRDHDYDHEHDHDYHGRDHDDKGVTGPVHTFVKTDKNANYKWGVRHHVGNKYAS